MEVTHRPCSRKSSDLAFGAMGKGEARTAPLEGTEAEATVSTIEISGAGTQSPTLTLTNRRMRTRMYGRGAGKGGGSLPMQTGFARY